MAKIQRLKISTDEKMSMLRGQPGHMPAAGAPTPEVVPAPELVPEAAAGTVAVSEPAALVAAPTAAPLAAVKPTSVPPVAIKRGRGRPPKVESAATGDTASGGLQPSLIRLEGETQRAALAYIHEELMLNSRRVYLKELVNEAVNYYLQHGPPAKKR